MHRCLVTDLVERFGKAASNSQAATRDKNGIDVDIQWHLLPMTHNDPAPPAVVVKLRADLLASLHEGYGHLASLPTGPSFDIKRDEPGPCTQGVAKLEVPGHSGSTARPIFVAWRKPQSTMMSDERLHVTQWGEAGPQVIFIHGSAQGSRVGGDRHFARQQELAARGWKIVVPDRPGHGQSRAPGRPDDAEADAVWVAELLGDRAHLIGHSFGGCVALAAAALRPEAVASLTLIEPGMQKLALDIPAVRSFGLSLKMTLMFTWSDAARAQKFAKLVGIPDSIDGNRPKDELKAMGRGISRLKVPGKADLTRQLAIVKAKGIPLLVVTGGWNAAFDATGERVAQTGGGLHEIIASPHHFPQAVSEAFNDRLDAFMRAADAQDPGMSG